MNPLAAATGIGSWPGTSARQAAEIVVGELHSLPHLVELPARGVGADLIGRAAALLVDLALDTTSRGYRIAARPGRVARRAASLLNEDIDALEEAWERAGLRGSGRTVKVQAPGPITLAAELELANGHRAITDPGAVRDLTSSLAEGIAGRRAEIARRLDAEVVVQFDEPSLPAALSGRLTGVTALTPVHPVDADTAVSLLDQCVTAVDKTIVHCCATDVPWEVFGRSQIDAISVDATALAATALDGIGELVEAGRTVLLGLVPVLAPPALTPGAVVDGPRSRGVSPLTEPAESVMRASASVTDRLGFPRDVLADRFGITPSCGLAGATAEWAQRAIGLCQQAADAIAVDPDR